MILFLADVRVKVNRKTLRCKTSGGGTEICKIKKQKHRRERGLGFWRVEPRILAPQQASEIGGLDGRGRALCGQYRVSFAESVLFPSQARVRWLRSLYI